LICDAECLRYQAETKNRDYVIVLEQNLQIFRHSAPHPIPAALHAPGKMSSCQYCNNLDIPCYEAVAQSRNLAGYDGVSAISSVRPRGLKPFINIELEDILSGANVTGCKTCIFFRDALIAVFKTLDGIKRVECIGTRAGTLKVEVQHQIPGFRNLEFYTLHGIRCLPITLVGTGY
jgi:hypothetical protein